MASNDAGCSRPDPPVGSGPGLVAFYGQKKRKLGACQGERMPRRPTAFSPTGLTRDPSRIRNLRLAGRMFGPRESKSLPQVAFPVAI